jgi:methyl-accepting chemotaxis protein
MNSFGAGLRPRIYGVFSILILIALGITLFATWKLSAVRDSIDRFNTIKDFSSRALEISNKLQIIRGADLRYMVDANEESIKEATAAESDAIDLLERAAARTISQERRVIYESLEGDFTSLRARRTALIGFVNEVQAARVKLFTGGDDLTDAAEKLVNARRSLSDGSRGGRNSQVATEVLLAGVANWRFQATRDPEGQATFRRAVERATAEIEAVEQAELPAAARNLVAPVKAALAAYNSSFESYSTNLLKSDELFWKDMTPLIRDMQRRLSSAEASIKQQSDQVKAETFESIAGMIAGQEFISALALLLGVLIAYFISRSIVKPVSAMTSAMRDLASGNFEVVLPGLRRKDEIGEMVRAVETFKVKAAEKARLEAQQEQARQDRNAAEKRAVEAKAEAEKKASEERAQAERRSAMLKLADEFETTVGNIIETVSQGSSELEAAANILTKTANTAQELSRVVASSSDEASANARSVASATEEMASSIQDVSRRVHESNKIASEAVKQAQNTNDQVMELSNAASHIGNVVKLITGIAEQTNLLALNATIEAARAGDAGKGFAVVAQEVKALAAQTAKATKEIDSQIGAMQTATQVSIRAIRGISDTISMISEISSSIAAAVEEQGTATREIARNVGQAATGAAEVATNITGVSRAANETGSGSVQVLSSARSLANQSDRLKLEVRKFVSMVRKP